MKRIVMSLTGLLILLSAGCRTVGFWRNVTVFENQGYTMESLGKVAVVPFENETGAPEAGRIVAKLFGTELRSITSLDVLPEHLVQDVVGAEDLKPGDPRFYQKLGQILKVDTLITGEVGEYRYRRSLGEAPAVGLNIRVIKVATGEIVWGASIADEGCCILTYRGSLTELAQRLSRALVRRFNRDL